MKKLNLVGLGILGSIIIFFVIAVPSSWIQFPEQADADENAAGQVTPTPQPAIPDSSLYFKLSAGWYEKVSERVREGRIGEYTNVNTAWKIYGDMHGFKHSLHITYKPGSLAKRSVTVYVYTPDTTIKDFSYEILPSDHVRFTVAADTDKVGIVRLAMHEFINLDR